MPGLKGPALRLGKEKGFSPLKPLFPSRLHTPEMSCRLPPALAMPVKIITLEREYGSGGTLIADSSGAFYGTAECGGLKAGGTAFKVIP